MNKFLGLASFALATAALAVSLWGPREAAPSPTPTVEAPAKGRDVDVESLERRVEALEDINLSLSRRLMAMEQRPLAGRDGGGAASNAELAAEMEQLRSEMRGMVAGEAINSEGGRTYLKEVMRTVQDEMRTEQRQERQQQMQQMQAQVRQERQERVRQFVTDARLNYNQEQELTRRLQEEETKRQSVMAEVQAGTKSPRDIRQDLRASRQATDDAMKAVLDEGQLAKYEEMRQEEGGPGRFRGGGGGMRAGGPGGQP